MTAPSPNAETAERCPACAAPLQASLSLPSGRTVFACRRCGSRRLLPLPTAAELGRLYGRPEYYTEDLAELHDDLVRGYDDGAPIVRLYRRHLELLRAAAPPPARLLEIGCARGVFLDLARRAGYSVSGIEPNQYAADYARREFGLAAEPASFADAALPAGSQDVVVALDVLEHVTDPAAFVAGIGRVLRPGGCALVGVPIADCLVYRLAETAARISGGRWTYPLSRLYGRGIEHLTMFSRPGLRRILASAGLAVVDRKRYGIPVGNMCDLGAGYRLALLALSPLPYELAVLARKT